MKIAEHHFHFLEKPGIFTENIFVDNTSIVETNQSIRNVSAYYNLTNRFCSTLKNAVLNHTTQALNQKIETKVFLPIQKVKNQFIDKPMNSFTKTNPNETYAVA